MDELQKAEHDAMLEMFQSPGWAALMRNTKERVDQFRAAFPYNVKTAEDLHVARGVISTLETLLKLQDLHEMPVQEDPYET
jgi:hypothetical protein